MCVRMGVCMGVCLCARAFWARVERSQLSIQVGIKKNSEQKKMSTRHSPPFFYHDQRKRKMSQAGPDPGAPLRPIPKWKPRWLFLEREEKSHHSRHCGRAWSRREGAGRPSMTRKCTQVSTVCRTSDTLKTRESQQTMMSKLYLGEHFFFPVRTVHNWLCDERFSHFYRVNRIPWRSQQTIN